MSDDYTHNSLVQHTLFCIHLTIFALYRIQNHKDCSKLGHAVVMNIWNIDAWQRQKSLPRQGHVATMISTVKFERNNLPSSTGDLLQGEFNWNMYEITPPYYVMNICILYRLYLNNMVFLRKSSLDTLMQIFTMLWHLVGEISPLKFDDYRVIRTGTSDLKLFLGGVDSRDLRFKKVYCQKV